MLSLKPICPISTRPAYFGARRIAPAAATSRTKAWGARPAVDELRPAQRFSASRAETATAPLVRFPVAAFAAQVIAQFDRTDADPRLVAQSYEAADALVPPQGTLVATKL